MSFLNLMRNRLKPKEVNEALENMTTPPADDVSYDNSDSGLTATDVQGAIDEIAGKLKRTEVVYSNLANDSETGYYVMLDDSILTTLNATRIISATVIGFNGFGSVAGIIPNIVLDVDGTRACMPFIKGTVFSSVSIKVRYIYE